MAAELHLAEDALALHLLLQHPEGLIDIVVTDENLHAAFLFDQLIGANGQGSDHWRTVTHIRMPTAPPYEPTSIFENCARRWRLWLPIGETETSVRRRFLGSSSDKSVLVCMCH